MATLSLCMIVRDEEAVLARCLSSVAAAVEEIIIVDTGSVDATREIAGQFTHKVLHFTWIDDFAAARNFTHDQATMDFQMWLDADDVLKPEDLNALIALKPTLGPHIDMVTMKYHTLLDEQGRPVMTSTRERLLRRECGFRWEDPVHECIPLRGNILHSDIAITHMRPPRTGGSTRNLAIYRGLLAGGCALTPRQQYYYARELYYNGLNDQAVQAFQAFLDGGRGWVEDNIAACCLLAACHEAMGQNTAAWDALLKSFRYASPRAETCCRMGALWAKAGDYRQALSWYETALALPEPQSLGFRQEAYWGYIPAIEACVCCCKLGEYGRALYFNRQAESHRPGDKSVAHNFAYISSQLALQSPTE